MRYRAGRSLSVNECVIAKYIRLSRDDAFSESLSIPNQRALLDSHIESLDMPDAEVLEFVDNGFTGTNLERPALQEMLGLVRTGKVNCILVKDFSRFARNEIESGYYIEKIFPLYRIRFIAVSEGFDSGDHGDGTGGIDVAFSLLMHEHYCHDLSRKVKSARRIKMKNGENIVANAVYGYRKNPATGKWEPDEEAAEVVRLIYQKALDSVPVARIRDSLSIAKYPTPREYMDMKRGKEIIPECAWESRAVINILENEQYTGSYVSGKYDKKAVGSKNHFLTDKSEWIVIPGSHPPIVGKEDYAAVQGLMGRIKGARSEKPIGRLLDCESAYRSRMAAGEIVTATPPYGYAKSGGGRWEPAEPAAGRVREIFDMALRGRTCAEIGERLHELGYPTPSEHIKLARGRAISPCAGGLRKPSVKCSKTRSIPGPTFPAKCGAIMKRASVIT
jgi:DNA invertase Pin-like site-specific DNA recombinase